jgi:predicted dehydrogenase
MAAWNRRSFIKTIGAGAIGSLAYGANSRVLGANEDLRVAVVGIRGRGKELINGFMKQKGVRIVTLCDCDAEVLNKVSEDYRQKGVNAEQILDVRKVLENKDVDIIATATPNHWHALLSVWAVQAGKDVYVEKPVSHNVWEGRQIVHAARKYNKIVQTGTQSRSNPGLREAIDWVRAGNLGKIKLVRGLCYKPRNSIGKSSGEQALPKTVDYDLWSGPAAMEPLTRKNLHYDWHWVWNTGNGDLGNQGIHQADIGRWALGIKELPSRVLSIGGRVGYVDDGETPNTQISFYDYAPAPMIFEVRGLPTAKDAKDMDDYRGAKVGVVIHCENGSVVMPSYSMAIVYDKDDKEVRRFGATETTTPEGKKKWVEKSGDHFANFVEAVRSRKVETLNADIEEGHLSSSLCHLANISVRTGKPASKDALEAATKDNAAFAETLGRMSEHLKKNQVDLAGSQLNLGTVLNIDPKTEKIANNEDAAKLLRREYRKGYEVPENV